MEPKKALMIILISTIAVALFFGGWYWFNLNNLPQEKIGVVPDDVVKGEGETLGIENLMAEVEEANQVETSVEDAQFLMTEVEEINPIERVGDDLEVKRVEELMQAVGKSTSQENLIIE